MGDVFPCAGMRFKSSDTPFSSFPTPRRFKWPPPPSSSAVGPKLRGLFPKEGGVEVLLLQPLDGSHFEIAGRGTLLPKSVLFHHTDVSKATENGPGCRVECVSLRCICRSRMATSVVNLILYLLGGRVRIRREECWLGHKACWSHRRIGTA